MQFARNRVYCPICSSEGKIVTEENISKDAFNSLTYASRKPPELMHYELSKCLTCDLLFSTHLPELSGLLGAYEAASYDTFDEARYAAHSYAEALSRLVCWEGISVLDVGCGDGQFLLECKDRGASRVAGIEPSTAPRAMSNESIKGQVWQGGWEEFDLSEKFQIVTLFQTVEHLRDPAAFVNFAHDALEPGGFLAIASHNFRAPLNRILGKKSPIYDVEHLQLFSPLSMRKLMEANGFEVVHSGAYTNEYPISYLLRLAPLSGKMKANIARFEILSRIILPVRLGNLITVAKRI